MKKTRCDLCDSPATKWGLGAYCDPCFEAFAKRSARFAQLAPDAARRLVNGSKIR